MRYVDLLVELGFAVKEIHLYGYRMMFLAREVGIEEHMASSPYSLH